MLVLQELAEIFGIHGLVRRSSHRGLIVGESSGSQAGGSGKGGNIKTALWQNRPAPQANRGLA